MNKQDHDHGGMGMMWMMMIGCMLPLLLLSFFGRGSSTLPRWVIPVAIVVMLGLHFVVMRRHHGKGQDAEPKADTCETHNHTSNDKPNEPPKTSV